MNSHEQVGQPEEPTPERPNGPRAEAESATFGVTPPAVPEPQPQPAGGDAGAIPASQPATGSTESAVSPESTPPRKRWLSNWGSSTQSLLISVVIAVFIIAFGVQAFQIPSESMERTLLVGDYLLVDKVHYGPPGFLDFVLPYRPIRRGDVVVFRYPPRPSEHFVKRVVGVPGDRVHLLNKQVYINGQPLDEPYAVVRRGSHDVFRDNFPAHFGLYNDVSTTWFLSMRRLVHDGELVVPPGHYFVLGDNRDNSLDSRFWGLVPRTNVVGRPLLIYWSMRTAGGARSAEAAPPNGKLSSSHPAFARLLSGFRWERILRVVQ